jgi:hypothetical protein
MGSGGTLVRPCSLYLPVLELARSRVWLRSQRGHRNLFEIGGLRERYAVQIVATFYDRQSRFDREG